jgi:hypothetical protein
MNFSVYDFLDRMCSEVKYKSMHKEIWDEMKSHMEEIAGQYMELGYDYETSMAIAASHMGNAKEIGEMFNKHYRLPFDSRHGLMLWTAAVTMLIYIGYPLVCKLYNGTIRTGGFNTAAVIILLAIFAVANVMYLRRGKLIITLRDAGKVTLGFLIGWTIIMAALLLSACFVRPWYYAYFPDIKIPFAPLYLPLLPKDHMVFDVEYFSWWFCLIVYMSAVKSRRKIKPFTLVAGWFRLSDGEPMEDVNVLAEGREKDGRQIRMAALAIFGLRRDKYGDEQKGFSSSDDY